LKLIMSINLYTIKECNICPDATGWMVASEPALGKREG
jgi:hypothetical protein